MLTSGATGFNEFPHKSSQRLASHRYGITIDSVDIET
jgi:hypothetical protein